MLQQEPLCLVLAMAIWDVAEWANNDITGVQLRKKLAQGAAGTVGGVAGGIAAGAAGGAMLGPVGALFGGLFGGIAGGFGGAAVGKALDEALWDEGEDSVMNTYEFFGWRSVHRGTRPTKPANEIKQAYLNKVWKKPSQKFTDREWSTVCNAHLMVLLRAMFPEFKKMLELSKDMHNKKSDGVLAIGRDMYSNFSVPPGTEELTRQPGRGRRFLSGLRRHCCCFWTYCCALTFCWCFLCCH